MQRVPQVRPVALAGTLEAMPGDVEPPCVVDAQVVEDATVCAHPAPATREPTFAGFLDGAQRSRVVAHCGPAPIVEGRVAAVIRWRIDRRLMTWQRALRQTRVYAPLAHLPAGLLDDFPPGSIVDTSAPDRDGTVPDAHPMLLLERARQAVARDREAVERELAEAWCAAEQRPLFIDGGIGGSAAVAAAHGAVGVVRNHRTLYVSGNALLAVLALGSGERSSVLRIAPRGRTELWSWYLRLRDGVGREALWGIVRVETAQRDDPTAVADTLSGWVLAEGTPPAMPDRRWDKTVYGIKNCERLLGAIC